MAFKIHSVDSGRVPPFEHLPCSAVKPEVGMAMILSGGKLAKATGTVAPAYISMREAEDTLDAGTVIPVIRVSGDIVFETTSSAAMTGVNIGDKVTLSTDGLEVTATKTGGVAEVVYIGDTAKGGTVRVRFTGAAAAAAAN